MVWDRAEKRRFVRVNLPCRVIINTPKKEIIDTTINNICEGGVGFTLRREVQTHSSIGLEIYEIKKSAILCKGVIRWVNAIESTRLKGNVFFNTGVEFSEIRPDDRLAIKGFIASIISSE